MIKRTRRRLDTCDCIVIYEWDSNLPAQQQVHTVSDYQFKCPAHENVGGIANNQDLYDNVVCQENGKKNIAIDLLLQNAPTSAYNTTSEGTRTFKDGISAYWSWTGTAPNRLLTIIINGTTLTTNQLNSVRAKLDQRFGVSNVNIING